MSACSNLGIIGIVGSAIRLILNSCEFRADLAALRLASKSVAELPLFMSRSYSVASDEEAWLSAWARGEEKRLRRLELVPASQSIGLRVFSGVPPSASCTAGEAEVVTGADLAAAERADEANNLCNRLL